MRQSFLLITISFFINISFTTAQEIKLKELSRYTDGRVAAMEIVSYDARSKSLFVTNGAAKTIDIINISNPNNPILKKQIDIQPYGGGVNSVVVLKKGYIAAAIENKNKQLPGKVVFFNRKGKYVADVTVGALPDMITVTPDGKKVLCANEGEPSIDYSQDPEGSISIIDISKNIRKINSTNVKTLNFAYAPQAIKGSILHPNSTYQFDMEPEYIAIDENSTLAAVTCQESNIIVFVNLLTDSIVKYAGLGFKDHSLPQNSFDASNKDNQINIKNWNVKGVFQPDAIASFTLNGKIYFVTANEGDARTTTETRIKKLNLDETIFPNRKKLQQSKNLGQLKTFTSNIVGDIDNDGDIDVLYSYGGRSFSIWNEAGELIWDSGNDFETYIAKHHPTIFNTNHSLSKEKDNRSDDKGIEPEAVTIGNINNQIYAFIGLERQGGIMIYNISQPNAPYFVDYIHSFDTKAGQMIDVAPECLLFIPASKSPSKKNLLIAANEVSGTLTIYEVF